MAATETGHATAVGGIDRGSRFRSCVGSDGTISVRKLMSTPARMIRQHRMTGSTGTTEVQKRMVKVSITSLHSKLKMITRPRSVSESSPKPWPIQVSVCSNTVASAVVSCSVSPVQVNFLKIQRHRCHE
jgi:hypothetical protein